MNLKSGRVFGLTLVLLGLVVFGFSIFVATQVPSSGFPTRYLILGFVALVVLALAGVRCVVFSIPRYKDLK